MIANYLLFNFSPYVLQDAYKIISNDKRTLENTLEPIRKEKV